MVSWSSSSGSMRACLALVVAASVALVGFSVGFADSSPDMPADSETVSGVSWTAPSVISRAMYAGLALAVTDGHMYMLSWDYGTSAYGVLSLFASSDGGATWSRTDVFGTMIRDGHPNICAYSNLDGTDTVLVASAPGVFAKSTDSGQTFSVVTPLPLGEPDMSSGYPMYWNHWMYMSIGTNASWLGGEPDDDVYVFGARVLDSYYSGLLYLSMTVSHDGGSTWTEPVTICPFTAYYPETTRDGDDLYMVFNALWGVNHADLFAMKSSDWGASWTAPELVFVKTFSDGGVNPCSFQNLGGGVGLVTVSDHHPIYSDNRGTWCTFSFADMALAPVGYVAGEGWNVGVGFAGKILDDGRMALGWLYYNYDLHLLEVRFAYGTGTLGPDPVALLQELIDLISGWTLHPKINRGLVAKLYAAIGYIEAGELSDAVKALESFLRMVDAQDGNALTSYWAGYLRDRALLVIELIQPS